MIVDFTVRNFRSIRDEQTLSFYTERSPKHLSENIHYPDNGKTAILASAGIYGANASGKSNVLTALNALFWMVSESHVFKEGAKIPSYEPYRLSSEKKQAATKFAIEFVVDAIRYVYEIAYSQKEITSEKLEFYSVNPTRIVRAKLFERVEGANWEDITFGSYYKGGTKKISLFKNQAYLSKAGNTADAPEQIRKIYQFFTAGVNFVRPNAHSLDLAWKKDKVTAAKISSFLNFIDTGISRLLIKHEEPKDFMKKIPAEIPESLKSKILDDVSHVPYFEHKTEEGELELFSEDDESDGTRALVSNLPMVFHALQAGKILVWDEMETSLHPHVADLILGLFNNPEVNRNHAQLLFTTHDLSLMNSERMRKDQLWLTEKVAGATQLISMDEFDSSQLKSNSPFAKWYYEGRLGGLPDVDSESIKALFYEAAPQGEGRGKEA